MREVQFLADTLAKMIRLGCWCRRVKSRKTRSLWRDAVEGRTC